MKSTLKLSVLFSAIVSMGVLLSCGKDHEADWLCKCPEGIPSQNPNIGTMGAETLRYNAVTEDIAKARCNEESAGRVSDCELSKVK